MAQSFGQVVPVLGPLVGYPGNWSRTADTIIVARPVLSTSANPLSFGAGAVLIASATGGSWQSFADYLAASAANAANLQQYFAGVAIRNIKVLQPYSGYAQTGGTVVATTATQATVGATTIVVASATGIVVGQSVEGAGIQANTAVVSISGTTITISLGTIAALSATNVTFTSSSTPAIGSFAQGTEGEVLVRSAVSVLITNGTPQAGLAVYVRTVANANIGGTSVGDFEAADDVATSAITIGTTIGSATLTTSAATGIVIGQLVTGPGIPANTFITAGSGTSWTMSNAALATIASGGASVFHNNMVLGSAIDPWIKFRTGQIDANGIAEILIANRHAA